MEWFTKFKGFQLSSLQQKNVIGGTIDIWIIREHLCRDESGNLAPIATCIPVGLSECTNYSTCYYDENGNLIGAYPNNCQQYCMA